MLDKPLPVAIARQEGKFTRYMKSTFGLAALLGIALVLGLTSCAATISFQEELAAELSGMEALPLSPSQDLAALVVLDKSQGMPTTYEVGKLLTAMLSGHGATVSVVSSRLEVGTRRSYLMFMHWEATYRLTLSVLQDGRPQLLQGVGTGSAGDSFTGARSASRRAILDCVTDLYRQARVILVGAGG